jgi:hypothetical protein
LGNILTGHVVLFVGKQIGGEIKCQEGETINVEWFPFDQIPGPLSLGHARRISDAISGVGGGVSISQEFVLTNQAWKISRKDLYELRDQSGLSRQDFYLQLVDQLEIKEKVELGNV